MVWLIVSGFSRGRNFTVWRELNKSSRLARHGDFHDCTYAAHPTGQSDSKGPKQNDDVARDTTKKVGPVENPAEQGETANIKQNTTNAGFFKGRGDK